MTYKVLQFNDVIKYSSVGKLGLPKSEWKKTGKFPIIGQGQDYIEGWSDREDILIKPNKDGLVVYGGHTRRAKHVVSPFIAGPNIKILSTAPILNSKFLTYFINQFPLENKGYADHFPLLRRIKIPIPSIEEQTKIVKILEEAETLKKKRFEADKKTEELIPALFNQMFGSVKTNEKKWPIIRFSEIGTSRLGKMLDAKKQTGKNKKVYIKNTNVKWGYFDLNNLPEMDFTESEQQEFRLKDGDLLICEGGEIGRTAIWRNQIPECYFQKALHRVRLDDTKASPEYIATLLEMMAKSDGFRELVGTATISHLTGVQLASIKIPLPPIKLQKEFAEKVNEVFAFKAKQNESAVQIEGLCSSLMEKSFTQ